MKIITDNAVYVQKNDFIYLNSSNLAIPASIFDKVFGYGVTIIDDRNRYEFIEFNAPEEIEFFKNIDWIIDYNEIKDLNEEEMYDLIRNICQEQNLLEEMEDNMDIEFKCRLLEFKILSVQNVMYCKNKVKFPAGIDLPLIFKQEKGIKKLIRTMFTKKS